jgi:WD40 repeat protein
MKWRYAVFSLPLLGIFQSGPLPGWSLRRTLDLKGSTHHVQGIDFEGHTAWITSVDREEQKGFLQTYSIDSGELSRTIEIQDNERYHPGGIASDHSSLWIPVAEYRAHSSSVIQRRDKKTLKVIFQFPVDDHIGCVALTPDYLIGGNWDSRDFYIWDHAGKLIRKVPNKTDNAYQDIKYDSPYLVASGLFADRSGAIDWLSFPSFDLFRRLPAGRTDRQIPLTREGLAIHQDQLVLLPEDEPSRLFFFQKLKLN